MDREFSITLNHAGIYEKFSVSGEMTLGTLKRQVKESHLFKIPRNNDEEKIYLKFINNLELTDSAATLSSLGITANMELKLQWYSKRSGKPAQGRRRDLKSSVYKAGRKLRFTKSKKEIKEMLKLHRAPPAAPDPNDPEGPWAGMTSNFLASVEEI